jgi:Tfp pilus assembly protein PilO
MKKPKIVFILVITAVIVSGLLFSLYVKSKISSIKSLRASVEELQKNNRAAIEKDTGGIKNLKELFPEAGNISEFIENVYRISKLRGIKNLTFEQKNREFIDLGSGKILKAMPVSGQKPRVIYSYPVKISFNSNYRNMAEFIREMQNQNRLATIGNLMVKRDIEYLTVEMVVNIYSTEGR